MKLLFLKLLFSAYVALAACNANNANVNEQNAVEAITKVNSSDSIVSLIKNKFAAINGANNLKNTSDKWEIDESDPCGGQVIETKTFLNAENEIVKKILVLGYNGYEFLYE